MSFIWYREGEYSYLKYNLYLKKSLKEVKHNFRGSVHNALAVRSIKGSRKMHHHNFSKFLLVLTVEKKIAVITIVFHSV